MKQLSLFDPIEIPLTKGYVALVDPIDSDLCALKWCIQHAQRNNALYAARRFGSKMLPMHRVIAERIEGHSLDAYEVVDHINHNRLDNRRVNLRVCTQQQNALNRTKEQEYHTSKFKGVSWCK